MEFSLFTHPLADSTPKSSHGFDLPRLPSMFTLTFDELQSSGLGKDYGSMNMDELMKSIWATENTREENPDEHLPLPRTLSLKTVDQVWREAVKEECAKASAPHQQRQRQRTLGETTLEEFLSMAGVVKEDDTSGVGAAGGLISEFDNAGIIIPRQQRQQDIVVEKTVDMYGLGDVHLGRTGPIPCSFGFNNGGGGGRGRKWTSTEKVMERRHKRMIKNRESAARSRARKQAHTMELEAEVEKLKAVNRELRRKQAEMLEIQRNQMAEEMNERIGCNNKRCWRSLRRTATGPW